ncbi:MAG TPA: acyltransferase family protein [Steroidobacteraceae bacterium]|nr:acyltransferase family protein [Steroidobacteraceae bacterium]
MTSASTPPANRYDFLDWLRVLAIFLLLFFHTGMLFVGWGWHITNAETIPALQWPMDLAHRLRMPLLFVIAGAGMWFALRRRSIGAFARERTARLLVPAIAGMFLIVPPQIFVERIAHGEWHGGYLRFMTERVLQFQPYPAGDFSWHHLWFVVYLFVYVLLLLPLMAWWRRAQPVIRPGAWIFLLALPLGLNEALLKPVFPETHNLTSDWYVFNHYLMLTLYGFALASAQGAWDWLAAQRRWALGIGLAVIIGLLIAFKAGAIHHDTVADAMFANVFTWTWLLAFLGYGRRYMSFENALIRWARDASYPVYILHQTVIIAIAYFVIQQRWSPWTKYWLVLVSTMVVCLAAYELIRRVPPLRLLFGMKREARVPRAPVVGSPA